MKTFFIIILIGVILVFFIPSIVFYCISINIEENTSIHVKDNIYLVTNGKYYKYKKLSKKFEHLTCIFLILLLIVGIILKITGCL